MFKKNSGKPVLLILRLHPLNFILALIAKLFFRVIYWRSSRIPKKCMYWFEILRVSSLYSFDEWQRLSDHIYDSWVEVVEEWRTRTKPIRYEMYGLNVDFSNNFYQWLAIQYEEHFQFISLINRWRVKQENQTACVYISDTHLYSRAERFYMKFPATVDRTVKLFGYVERFSLWAGAFVPAVKQLLNLSLKPTRSFKLEGSRCIWGGISSSEFADREGKRDFSFLVTRGLMNPSSCLFVLPKKPGADCLKRLHQNDIKWVIENDWWTIFSIRERFFLAAKNFFMSIRFLLSKRNSLAYSATILKYIIEAQPWILIGKRLQPTLYLSSLSACWPEHAAVAAMNAVGAKTINWFYSVNSFSWNSEVKNFKDRNVELSVWVSQEIWVWNDVVKRWLDNRVLPIHNGLPKIRLIGPVMCGDSRLVEDEPVDLRIKFGFQRDEDVKIKYISIFDVAPITTERELVKGNVVQAYTLNNHEIFYEHLMAILNLFPHVRVILKLKKLLNASANQYSQAQAKLIDQEGSFMRQGRVIVLDSSTDPYLPIAFGDVCIGFPFTSPVLAALHSGRGGIYHDPLGQCYAGPPALLPLITHNLDELSSRLRERLENRGKYVSADHQYLKPTGDPAVRFAQYLKECNLSDAASLACNGRG